jgi:Activator of Hsp90 ATPase homolog 1-like protein
VPAQVAARPAAHLRRLVAAYPAGVTGTEPIVVTIDLAATSTRAYEAFSARFADWWPVATHSLSRDSAARCRLEARPGGTVTEQAPDGTRHRWGTIEAAETGRRLRFTWHPGREPESAQWVDVVFEPHGDGSRVTLTHGGWENLGVIAPILRREYLAGWQHVLGEVYAAFVDRARER